VTWTTTVIWRLWQGWNLSVWALGEYLYLATKWPRLYPGWPKNTACARADQYCSVQSITLADLDNDSSLEVIVGTDNRISIIPILLYIPRTYYVWRSNGQIALGIGQLKMTITLRLLVLWQLVTWMATGSGYCHRTRL